MLTMEGILVNFVSEKAIFCLFVFVVKSVRRRGSALDFSFYIMRSFVGAFCEKFEIKIIANTYLH
jgi:hypothetical protein